MNRLWVRLTLAFVVVAVIGIGAAALLADLSIDREFRTFVARTVIDVENSGLTTQLVAYYEQNSGWDGVAGVLAQIGRSVFPRRPGPQPRDWPRDRLEVLVADADWRIAFDSRQQRAGDVLPLADREFATPLQSQDEIVGYLLITPGPIDVLLPTEQAFVDQVRRSMLLAGLIATAAGAILGLAFSRYLTRPLQRLATAARAIAARDLAQRVEPGGTLEVANVAHAFNDMADSLQKAETLRRNLVADVAHELRTPLSVLQGNLSALLDGVFPLDMPEVGRLYDETRLLSRLVDDLRELAQAEAGQLTLSVGAVDVGSLIESTASAFSASAAEKQVQLTVEVSAHLPRLRADAERVAQVLRILLTNALRHTESGGAITVSVSAIRDGRVEVSVSDTGEGIAEADLPFVFDRFWRGDKSRARESGGSGLGLAIARHLTELQGGRIGVESRVGKGSRFWFELPVEN
jgi:two-component system OmpR family sensor kinase/two-component system sensor histidine kinase BaeS